MEFDKKFATQVPSLGDAPEPFRQALSSRLTPSDSIRHLVFGPSDISMQMRSPATLLAVTDRDWMLAADDADGRVTVARSDYNDTLLLELTEILLFGQMKIDDVAGGDARSSIVNFNTVTEKPYHEAARLILAGIDGGTAGVGRDDEAANAALEAWPTDFRSFVAKTLAGGQRLLGLARWPAVYGGFQRELAPGAALLLTERELVLVSQERAIPRAPTRSKYGRVSTFFPLIRLAQYHLHRHPRFTTLSLEMHASHGGEQLEVLFPPEHEKEVIQVMQQAVEHRPTARAGVV